MISVRSMVSISEWRYRVLIPRSASHSESSSESFLVRVVTSARSPLAIVFLTSSITSRVWPAIGRTSTGGSTSPVGRMICSAIRFETRCSYSPGVAETKITCRMYSRNSSHFRGRLS